MIEDIRILRNAFTGRLASIFGGGKSNGNGFGD